MSRRKRKENYNRFHSEQFEKFNKKGEVHLRLIQGGAVERTRHTKVDITPRNFHQDDLLGYLEDRKTIFETQLDKLKVEEEN